MYGTENEIRINNAYEPVSGTHQPYGWDQMAALYRYYKVVGCRMKITAVNFVADTCGIISVRPVPVNENLTLTGQNVSGAMERPGVINRFLVAGSGKPTEIHLDIDIPRLLGVSREQFDADASLYSATVTGAPSRFAYVQMSFAGYSTTSSCVAVVECEYDVHFWQRITQAQS